VSMQISMQSLVEELAALHLHSELQSSISVVPLQQPSINMHPKPTSTDLNEMLQKELAAVHAELQAALKSKVSKVEESYMLLHDQEKKASTTSKN